MNQISDTELDRYKALGNGVVDDNIAKLFNEPTMLKSDPPPRQKKMPTFEERRQPRKNKMPTTFEERRQPRQQFRDDDSIMGEDNVPRNARTYDDRYDDESFVSRRSDRRSYRSYGSRRSRRSSRRSRGDRSVVSGSRSRIRSNRDRIEREAKRKFYVDELRQWGVPVDGSASLPDLQYQYMVHKEEQDAKSSISFMRDCLGLSLTGVEYTNKWAGNYLSLDGWAQSATRDMTRYDNCLKRIHTKYFRNGSGVSINPFLELAFLIFSSAILHHFNTKMNGGVAPPPPKMNSTNNVGGGGANAFSFPSMPMNFNIPTDSASTFSSTTKRPSMQRLKRM